MCANLFCKFFSENCMKMKEFGPEKGVRIPCAPNGSANVTEVIHLCAFNRIISSGGFRTSQTGSRGGRQPLSLERKSIITARKRSPGCLDFLDQNFGEPRRSYIGTEIH